MPAPTAEQIETKFNPWHDPKDGRFTFAGSGRYFGRGQGRTGGGFTGGGGGSFGGGGATGRWGEPEQRVRSSPTTAKPRKIAPVAGIRPGPGAKPSASIGTDSIRPVVEPNPSRPVQSKPPAAKQGRSTTANGYDYHLDAQDRTTQVSGTITLAGTPKRSRDAQAGAGKPNRLPTDDGGHYIAARFNGPRDEFNHFAQDANFNRGAYRVMEDEWAKATKAGQKVFVRIQARYADASRRPDVITVRYKIGDDEQVEKFRNRKGGR